MRECIPDLILLDIMMPKMDGFDVLKELKKDERLKAVPVIMLTNLGDSTDKDEALKRGADDYLVKALHTPMEVVKKVEELLQKRGDTSRVLLARD